MEHDPQMLRKKAQSLSSAGKSPGEAWREMREWAHGAGPLAMDIAVQEFITAYGRDPASARLIPEILQGSAFSPIRGPSSVLSIPRPRLDKPAPSFQMRAAPAIPLSRAIPSAIRPIAPISAPQDRSSLRDMPYRMHEALQRPLRTQISSGSGVRLRSEGAPVMSANKPGEHMIQTLIRHLRSHGRGDDVPHRKTRASEDSGGGQVKKRAVAKKGKAKKRPAPRKDATKKKAAKKKAAPRASKRRKSGKR